jgi:hypothetical protein
LEKRDSKIKLNGASLEEEVAMMSLSCTSGHLMIEPFRLAVPLAQMGKVQFLAKQKSGSAAGTNTRLLPTVA